ncbi:MAG: thioesterase family protein [Vicinamibacterales bacterium]
MRSDERGLELSVPAAFYDACGPTSFRASPATVGPWHSGLQHGGPPAALLGRTLERQGGPPGSRIARIAFDFFGPVPVGDVSVQADVVRRGERIQLSAATMEGGGRTVMRAHAWHLRAEPGRSPVASADFVVPPLPSRETTALFAGVERFGYGDALEWRFVTGGFDELGPATVWSRCRHPLVAGEPLTGVERTLVMVDAANGTSAVLPITTWTFVPVELTVVAERWPDTEWVGMSSTTTIGADGIGATQTRLFDERGAFGHALQTLFVTPR